MIGMCNLLFITVVFSIILSYESYYIQDVPFGNQNLVYDGFIRPRAPKPQEVVNWPSVKTPHLGQISGVSVDMNGNPVIFHRGPRVFNGRSFNASFNFQMIAEGPIDVDTVLTLNRETGAVINGWGMGLFYMPHGITIDRNRNIWLTDIAMHQVFKFLPESTTPTLTFGKKFQSGDETGKLCMPTAVAIASTGDIFVADGYCNSRILKYNYRGELLRVFPDREEFLNLQVPHSLTLMEKYDILCIADRDNMRVICIDSELTDKNILSEFSGLNIQQPDLGRVFAITSYDNFIYAINGPTSPMIPIQGFTIHPTTESIVDHWDSFSKKMWMPHDIAISPDGTDLYIVSVSPNHILKFKLTNLQRRDK